MYVRRIKKKAGIEDKDVTFHCNRHTVATLAMAANADISTVREILGQKSTVSAQVYAKVSLATGKGYADLILIPRRNVNKPAIVLELKFKKDVDAAIDQIKRKEYVNKIEQYTGDILLVGINYDKKEKKHTCVIETVTK